MRRIKERKFHFPLLITRRSVSEGRSHANFFLPWPSGFLNLVIKVFHEHILFADKILFSSPIHKAYKGGILKVSI